MAKTTESTKTAGATPSEPRIRLRGRKELAEMSRKASQWEKRVAEDSDSRWFRDNVICNFDWPQTDLDRRGCEWWSWHIPYCKLDFYNQEDFRLVKRDFTEPGRELFTLAEAIEIEKRLYQKFGFGLLSPTEWAFAYAFTSNDGFDNAVIARNLGLRFREGESQTAYWANIREVPEDERWRTDFDGIRTMHTYDDCDWQSGVAFTLDKAQNGFALVEHPATDKLRLRFGVANVSRFQGALIAHGSLDYMCEILTDEEYRKTFFGVPCTFSGPHAAG